MQYRAKPFSRANNETLTIVLDYDDKNVSSKTYSYTVVHNIVFKYQMHIITNNIIMLWCSSTTTIDHHPTTPHRSISHIYRCAIVPLLLFELIPTSVCVYSNHTTPHTGYETMPYRWCIGWGTSKLLYLCHTMIDSSKKKKKILGFGHDL